MSNKSFEDFIEEQNSVAEEVEIDWGEKLNEWKQYLTEFYQTVESFLKPYICDNKLSLDRTDISIDEEYIGQYTVQQLKIRLGKMEIILKPIGTNLIAAKGRVDMIGPSGQVKFVLVPRDSSEPKVSVRVWTEGEERPKQEENPPITEWAWKIATSPPRISYIELETESFQSALMEVANG